MNLLMFPNVSLIVKSLNLLANYDNLGQNENDLEDHHVEPHLIAHHVEEIRNEAIVPSISEPIFQAIRQDVNGFAPFIEEMQDCNIDTNGFYRNEQGSCIGECRDGKVLVVYDYGEGFCCCG
jgi:hypothetical protein